MTFCYRDLGHKDTEEAVVEGCYRYVRWCVCAGEVMRGERVENM
jgi:hypothetical protein